MQGSVQLKKLLREIARYQLRPTDNVCQSREEGARIGMLTLEVSWEEDIAVRNSVG